MISGEETERKMYEEADAWCHIHRATFWSNTPRLRTPKRPSKARMVRSCSIRLSASTLRS